MEVQKFNIRVYGLLIRDNALLVTDEYRMGTCMTKLPGGGLHYGEGTIECLRRECLEELGQEVEVLEHFYTTDYFQPTLFLPVQQQLISIYYFIRLKDKPAFKVSVAEFDFPEDIEGSQSFRFIDLDRLKEEDMTLPVDRIVVRRLKDSLAWFRD